MQTSIEKDANIFKRLYILSILILVIIIIGLVFTYFYKDANKHKVLVDDPIVVTDNGFKDSVLNQENYDKVGINPEKYSSLSEFLSELKSFTGVELDVVNEDFVIGKKMDDGSTIYIPFDQKDIKGDVFAPDGNKNLAILDIYQSYKDSGLYGAVGSEYGQRIIFQEDVNHQSTSTLNQVFAGNLNVNDLISELESIKETSLHNLELLSYSYDLIGDYDKANKTRSKICSELKVNCDRETEVYIYGTIKDQDNNPVSGATISLLNDDSISTISNSAGNYKLTFKYYPFSHIRFKTSYLGYSDGFSTINLNSYMDDTWENKFSLDFILNKAHKTYEVNKKSEEYKGKKYIIFTTDQSRYIVPSDGLYYENGRSYKGNDFSVYLYEFNKWSKVNNLIENDTFSPVYGYVGNIMKTFGMPYIQFFDANGKELFIHKSNPMILRNNIYHMKELYENYDNIYEALTKEDMKFLVDKTTELGGYPIDFDFLTQNEFLRWPAWWALDRKKGVWENIGAKVLSEEGLVEVQFYSISD